MRPVISPRTFLTWTLAAALALTGAVSVAARQDHSLAVASAKVTIAGSSNVHDWVASTETLRITNSKLGAGLNDSGFLESIVKPGGLDVFEIAVPVLSLKSDKDGLDKNMYKALKAPAFPSIVFRALRLQPGTAAGTLRATGMLKIAGIEREIAFDLKTQLAGAALTVKGIVPILMTDYGIVPPKALLGMVKADPKVTVTFEAVLSVPPATQESMDTGGPMAVASEEPQAAPAAAPAKTWKDGRDIPISYFRPMDKRGLNTFETTKEEGYAFDGFKLDIGANFTSQVQNLSHSNTASPVVVGGVNTNQLMEIGFGVNNSTANLAINAQLAPGIRVNLTSYLSSRHHNETWVKDGYLQIDKSPIDIMPLNVFMEIATVRMGHMEINYGDAHFRRSDNGNAMFNPFVGNYLLDAFTTEIAAEVYLKPSNFIVMGAITAGEIRGSVLSPKQRGPSFIGKLGYDRQINKDLRVRLTGSAYKTNKSLSNTLYSGDRAGSRYYFVLENTAATETAQKDSGLLNPGFKNKVTALQMNPFVKLRGLEVFGVLERAKGKASTELTERTWNQVAVDAVYRFHADECGYIGARYNRAKGELAGIAGKVGASRWEFGGGWFMTTNILTKVTYTNQKYFDYPATNIKNGGKFKGMMIEAVIGF